MYSVLIQNKKTIESFHEFHPLFLEALGGKVNFCRWFESGTTIETALPELSGMTNDKKEWRAIIVHLENEEGMEKFPSSFENPYDFQVNEKNSDVVEESPVPLIRLTHMLGGVPAPEVEYEAKEIREDSKEPRIVYIPKRSAEKEIDYANLVKKYEYNGKLPSEIILITMRCVDKRDAWKDIRNSWKDRFETNSSFFWKRNNYPSDCRFLVYDYSNEGAVQKEADMFNFWTCVLLLATNEINSDALQAYRLYSINSEFDRSAMEEMFRYKVASLLGVRNFVNNEIKRDIEERMGVTQEPPRYDIDFPTKVQSPDVTGVRVDTGEFKLCAPSSSIEREKWYYLSEGAETKLEETFKKAERALEESADHMRSLGKVSEDIVRQLDRFQEADMRDELSKTHKRILSVQSTLPGVRMKKDANLAVLEQKVCEEMETRVDKSVAMECAAIILLLIFFAFLPAVFITIFMEFGNIWGAVCTTLALFAGFGVVELIMLWVYRYYFRKKIEAYNSGLNDHIVQLSQNTAKYEEFIDDIVHYARGNSYLDILSQKRYKMQNSYSGLQKHSRAAGVLIEKIRRWGTAFYFNAVHSMDSDNNVYIDTDIDPKYNMMYTFEEGQEYNIPLNESGDFVVSPFAFVSKLKIRREELYEDERSDN